MWSVNDKRFLRSLRIKCDGPPAPLPRFRVEPSKAGEGWYSVVDAHLSFKSTYEIGPKEFPDPRAAAEDVARQLNQKHQAPS